MGQIVGRHRGPESWTVERSRRVERTTHCVQCAMHVGIRLTLQALPTLPAEEFKPMARNAIAGNSKKLLYEHLL